MSDDPDAMVAQLLDSLEGDGFRIRSTSRRGRYVIESRDDVPLSPSPQLLLDPDRVAGYTATLEREIAADPEHPLQGLSGLSMLQLYLSETLESSDTPEKRFPDRFGLRRRRDGEIEFFSVGDTVLPIESPVSPGEEHNFTWIATPREEDQDPCDP